MFRVRVLVTAASLLASTATLAHSAIDPVAGLFTNVAGNGGLAWFVYFSNFAFR